MKIRVALDLEIKALDEECNERDGEPDSDEIDELLDAIPFALTSQPGEPTPEWLCGSGVYVIVSECEATRVLEADEPITEEWLKACGFRDAGDDKYTLQNNSKLRIGIKLLAGSANISINLREERKAGFYEGDLIANCMRYGIKSRSELIALVEAVTGQTCGRERGEVNG